jgi:hypothetical protein
MLLVGSYEVLDIVQCLLLIPQKFNWQHPKKSVGQSKMRMLLSVRKVQIGFWAIADSFKKSEL